MKEFADPSFGALFHVCATSIRRAFIKFLEVRHRLRRAENLLSRRFSPKLEAEPRMQLFLNHINADVFAEDFGDGYRAVGVLILLNEGGQNAGGCEA